MYRLLFIFISILFSCNLFSQSTWLQSAGGNSQDEALAVTVDGQNNIITTGYFSQSARFDNFIIGSSGMGDVFISKQNVNGDYIWVTKAGGLNADRAFGIAVDQNNEIYITGVFKGTVNFGITTLTSISNSQDVFVAKLDVNGNFLWAVSFGGNDTEISNGIDVDSNGNIVIAGQYKGTAQFGSYSLTSAVYNSNMASQAGLPSYDGYLVKMNSSGIVQWAKNISGEYDDRAMKVVFDSNNQIYLSGQYSDTLNTGNIYNNNSYNASFLLKTDGNGNDVWFRRILAPQIMIYDIKTDGNNILLTGDAKGNININTSPTSIVSCNSGDFNIYVLKFNASGNLIWSSTQFSKNSLSSRAIALSPNGEVTIGGTFNCSFTQLTSMTQAALFNSVGYKDVFMIHYDAQGNRVWEKNYGGISNDWIWGMEMLGNDQPVIAGSFGNGFCMPFGSDFIFHSTIENISSEHGNNSLTVCSYNDYGNYAMANGMGNKDILSAKPVDLSLAPYDYYQRQNGTCQRDTLMPILFPNVDSVMACDSLKLFILTQTTVDFKSAPAWEFNWSNGSDEDTITALTTGWYKVEYGFSDDCRRFSDSIYVEIFQSPFTPVISSSNFPIEQAIPVYTCLNKLAKLENDTAILIATQLYPGYEFHWVDPMGNILTDTTINASAFGTYSLIVTSPNGLCSNSYCVAIYDYMSIGGDCSGVLDNTSVPTLVLTDSNFNYTDTIIVCKNDFFGVEYFDSLDFVNGNTTNLNTFIRWTILQGGFNYQFSNSAPFTFNFHHQEYLAISSGNCILKAEVLHPVTLQVLQSVIRNFYLNVREAPLNNPIISGPVDFCPGDTVLLSVTGGDEYQWSGPGIVSMNSPVNDSLYITMEGEYQLNSTTRDTILDCPDLVTVQFEVSSPSAPIVNMNPYHGVICPNDSVLLIAQPGSGYQWYGPTGSVISLTNSVWVTVPGFYYYTYFTVEGCELMSDMAEVREYSTPFLEADPGNNLCVGGSLTVNVESNELSLVNWMSPLSGNSFSQTITAPGIYQASITFCNITTIVDIEITQLIVDAEIIYNGNDTVCTNTEVVLLTDPAGATINWLPGNESSSIFTTNEPGVFILELTDMSGCYDSDTLSLNYFPEVTPPLVSDTMICGGTSITIVADAAGDVSWYDMEEYGNLIGNNDSLTVNLQNQDTALFVSSFDGTCFSDLSTVNVLVNPSSVQPTIFGDSILCLNDTLMLYTDTIANMNYFWSGPNGFADSSQNIQIISTTLLHEGIYSLVVSDTFCSSQPETVEVIFSIPQLQGFSSQNLNVCANDSLILSDTLSGNYVWQDGDTTDFHPVNASGEYYFTYVNGEGCTAYSDTIQITVLPAPDFSIVMDTAVCSGSSLFLTSASSGNLSWTDLGDNSIYNSDTLELNSIMADMSFLIYATDSLGCQSSMDTINVFILPNEAAPTIVSNDTVCENSNLILEAISTSGTSYFWSGPNGYSGDSSTDTLQNVNLNFSGTYSVYTSNGNCFSDTASINVFVYELPDLDISGDSSLCIHDSILLSVISSDVFYWNDGDDSSEKFIQPEFSQWYYVVTDHYCGLIYDSIYIIVNPLPVIDLGPDQTILLGLGTDLSVQSGLIYEWSPTYGLNCSDCASVYASPEDQTEYFLTVTDLNGCSATDSVTIFVRNETTCFIPNSFTPNGDGNNDVFMTRIHGLENFRIMIFDRWGELIFESNNSENGWDGTYRGSNAQDGTYVFLISGIDLHGEIQEWRGHLNLYR